ncbi:hypothetical protein [Thioalkalivibrio sp. ALJ2]|uniref:hypothetical protein n=1 Tax=Thioalkalivibrio sp. ALJ2 TaxID=1261622 RepID=UPI0012DF9C57|nr:hypothetical protein [Thioalkalivibrio sp. ALJ2]
MSERVSKLYLSFGAGCTLCILGGLALFFSKPDCDGVRCIRGAEALSRTLWEDFELDGFGIIGYLNTFARKKATIMNIAETNITPEAMLLILFN